MFQIFRQSRWLLLTIALAAMIVAACGDDDGGTDEGSGASATAAVSMSSPMETPSGDASSTMAMDMGNDMDMDHDMDGTPGTSTDMDLMFLDGMVPHHQSAIEMAEIALEEGEQEEIRTLAQEIITSQESEIEQMTAWRNEWFPDAPMVDMSDSDMAGMNMSESDMQMLRDADSFDKTFLEMMIPHHQSAIMMAEDVLTTTERPEIMQLAEEIIAAQEAEIEQMQEWLAE